VRPAATPGAAAARKRFLQELWGMMNWRTKGPALTAALALGTAALLTVPAVSGAAAPLRVCADPGNMPLSNKEGEGLQNKMAQVLAQAMHTNVTYDFRPSIERGLIRNTLDADVCDVMFDMPIDSDDVLTTRPLYRTTFVFVTRTDRNLQLKNLDDPRLKKLRIGVYETSAIREALADHGIGNVQVHYISHNGDLAPENQPSYQIQQVLDGKLDIAGAWGPMAGYYKVTKREPLTLQPANLMSEVTPLQFEMSLAVRRNNRTLQKQLDEVLVQQKDALRQVLDEYGVPLVKCDDCIISGDLPEHGPYVPQPATPPPRPTGPTVSTAQLEQWLAHGSTVTAEFSNAILADDKFRAEYLLTKHHADINAIDLQGDTPLAKAIEQRYPEMVVFLVEHGADVNKRDRDGWTPIMMAAYADDAASVKLLSSKGADVNATNNQKLTALGVASQYSKNKAALALIEAGADPGHPVGEGGYTPLMLASANDEGPLAQALIQKGADVNARNNGGVTALMMATAAGRPNMMDLLIKAGANVKAQTDRGDTALTIAHQKNDPKVLAALGEKPGA
jgi:quinoprotein dehydrogenase-associated probable ABC transporter substrate-binding protein